jgi:DUF4097 and DUF4098 domain-containing protein YvlB
MNTKRLHRSAALLALAAMLLSPGLVTAEDSENNLQKSFTVSNGGKLVVDADRGSIEVAASGTDKVDVQVLRKVTRGSAAEAEEIFGNHEVTFQQEGNQVTVKARNKKEAPGWRPWRANLQVRYVVSVPRQFNLDLKTAGGSVGVPDLTGDVRMQTAGGSLKTGAIEGSVWARTAGGSVTVGGATGAVDVHTAGGSIHIGDAGAALVAETSGGGITVKNAKQGATVKTAGGSIRIDEANGAVRAETSGGSITIKTARGSVNARTAGGSIDVGEVRGAIDAHTSAGSVRVAMSGPLTEDSRLDTSGGSISLTIPSDFAADIDAKTSGGRVTTDIPVTTQGELGRGALQGKIGAGGKLFKLRTSAGSIHIKKL